VLLDSVTAILQNEMFPPPDYNMDYTAPERVAEGLKELGRRVKNIVYVSDYIYSDAALYDEITEGYRRGLAYADRLLAKESDRLAELCAGNVKWHK
jgi:adenosylcobinamide kinase/adenosylcobinamide-phosphate guanylyltransferase